MQALVSQLSSKYKFGFCLIDKWGDPSSGCYRQYYECWPQFYDPEYYTDGRYWQRIFRQSGGVSQVLCSAIIRYVRDEPQFFLGSADDTVNKQHRCRVPPCPQLAPPCNSSDQATCPLYLS